MGKIGNENYTVRFEHNIEPKYLYLKDGDNTYKVRNKTKSTTICYLLDERFKPIFQATVEFMPNLSQFYVKEVGRFESLCKVLKNLEIEESEEIIIDYFARFMKHETCMEL